MPARLPTAALGWSQVWSGGRGGARSTRRKDESGAPRHGKRHTPPLGLPPPLGRARYSWTQCTVPHTGKGAAVIIELVIMPAQQGDACGLHLTQDFFLRDALGFF